MTSYFRQLTGLKTLEVDPMVHEVWLQSCVFRNRDPLREIHLSIAVIG